jgi:hypothetical protein
MKTEILNINFSLIEILKFKEIEAPLFQRPYSWGIGKLSEKSTNYFEEFLSNNKKNSYLGTISIHSKSKYDYEKICKKDFLVNLSDGQHRLATALISLQVVYDIMNENPKFNKRVNNYMKRQENLNWNIHGFEIKEYISDILKNSNLKIMKKNLRSENILKHLTNEKQEIKDLLNVNESIQKQINNIKSIRGDKLGNTQKNESKKNLRQEIQRNNKKIKEIEKDSPVYSSYINIKNHIGEIINTNTEKLNEEEADKIEDLKMDQLMVVVDFIIRFDKFKIGLTILQPLTNQCATNDSLMIENEAFLMFNELNAQAEPLTPFELLKSFLSQKFKSEPLNVAKKQFLKYLTEKSDEQQKISHFGLDDKNIIDFIMKISSRTKDSYIFVNNFYTSSEDDLLNEIIKINGFFTIIENTQISLTEKENNIPLSKILLNLFIKNNMTIPLLVFYIKYLAKKEKEKESITEEDRLKIFKTLVQLLLMTTYVPKSGKRPNLMRDLIKEKESINDANQYIYKHFFVEDKNQFKTVLRKHLNEFEFGQQKHRGIGKLLLICEASKNITTDLKNYNELTYEHIFPSEYKDSKDNEHNEIFDKYNEFVITNESSKNNLDKTMDYTELLGNSTILHGKINSKLSNLSPYEKVIKIQNNTEEEINRNSFLNQEHLSFLENNYSDWGVDLIQNRTESIADIIISFLID